MSNCQDFGIFNGCQPHCPVLREGKCDSQREMEITYILSGEWDIEEGSPCIKEDCEGHFVSIPPKGGCTCWRGAGLRETHRCIVCSSEHLECSECGLSAAAVEESVKIGMTHQKPPEADIPFSLGALLAAAGAENDQDRDETIAATEATRELLPIHRAMSQARTQHAARPWVSFWLEDGK